MSPPPIPPTPPAPATLASRIDEVLERRIFSDARAWSLAAGLSYSYVSVLRHRLRTGRVVQGKFDAIQALARAAGVTTEWLSGRSERSTGDDPLFSEFFAAVHMRPALVTALTGQPQRWHVMTVVRALLVVPDAGVMPCEAWWAATLDRIERARYEPTHGDGDAVLAASRAQTVDTRSPLVPSLRLVRTRKPT